MRVRSRGRRLALAVGVAAILAQGAAMAADSTAPIAITTPANATKDDLNPGRLYLAPSMAVDPSNQVHVAAAMTELRTRTCFFMRSSDGGRTWVRPQASPTPQSYPFCNTNNRGSYQAQIAYGRNGAVYMAFPGWDTQDAGTRGNTSLIVSKSTDFGENWDPVIARDNRGKQGQEGEYMRPVGAIAVDRKSAANDIVYVGYAANRQGFSAPNAAPREPTVVASTDGGATYGEPVNLAPTFFSDAANRTRAINATTTTQPAPGATTTTTPPPGSRAADINQVANFGGFQPVVTVADNGTAYAVWPAGSANLNPGIPTGIMVSKTVDQGKTWTTTQAGTFSYNNGSFIQAAWSPGGGADGTLHIVYPGVERPEVAGYSDITYIKSTDAGQSFSAPKNITDDNAADLVGQYYPNIAVSPDGDRVDVTWYDTRDDPGYRSNDVYYAYSTDDGDTWSKNIRVSDIPIDRRFGVWSVGYDVTTPPGMGSADSYTVFGWDDTRNNDTAIADNNSLGGGAQDFYVAQVQFEAIGGGTSKAAKIILAGVVGLLGVSLVLILVAFIARNRAGGAAPKPAKKAAAPTPAAMA
ncbi:MAG: hypothetical protein ACRD12_08865 [Acidimicrobiales bacterium]